MTLLEDLSSVTWLEPWAPLTPEEGRAREAALRSRLSEAHPLHSREVQAVAARSDDASDVLFLLRTPDELCVVNLGGARSPFFASFGSVDEFVQGCMLPDHLEHTDDDV